MSCLYSAKQDNSNSVKNIDVALVISSGAAGFLLVEEMWLHNDTHICLIKFVIIF